MVPSSRTLRATDRHPAQVPSARVAEAVVHRYERSHGRHLLDTRIGGWPDLDSEAMLVTRAHWGARAAHELERTGGARYVSFREGVPQHAAQVQAHAGALRDVTVTHDQLVGAASLGGRCWLYLVSACGTGQPHLLVLRHPASLGWTPSAPSCDGAGGGAARPTWHISAHDLRRSHAHAAAA